MGTPDNIPFFFIIGRPRTGTTLLLRLFDAHPNVAIPWECQYIVNLYPRYGKITCWSEEDLMAFYRDLLDTWQFKFWPVDHEKLRSELLSCKGENTYADVCRRVHLNYSSLYPKEGIRMIGDKNPGYTIYTELLKKIIPDAKFIFINRDYRDNFYSIRNVDFELPVVPVVVYKWKHFYKKALRAKRRYPDDVRILKYEDLAGDPHREFRALCIFLGLPWHPEVFDFHRKKEETLEMMKTERIRQHHKSLMDPVHTQRIGLWKKHLDEKEVRMADHVAGEYAERAGYRRKYRKAGTVTWLRCLPGTLYARMLYIITGIVDRFPYKMRAAILNKGPLALAKGFRKFRG